MHTGWVFTHAVRNNAHVHIRAAFDAFVASVPFLVTGIDCDNGSEFINYDLIEWAGQRAVFFTRSRPPHKSNDQATIESKNNHLVRRYGFYHRYDTPRRARAPGPAVGAGQ